MTRSIRDREIRNEFCLNTEFLSPSLAVNFLAVSEPFWNVLVRETGKAALRQKNLTL
jgi:hypothetical protein